MIPDIWNSFRRTPLWVQIWVAIVLVPVNMASLWFWTAPYGWVIAFLTIGGMAPNIGIMLAERGLSKRMAVPHVVIWPFLVLLLIWLIATGQEGPAGYRAFLWILLGVDVVSLAFDIPDTIKWLKGDRKVA